MIEPEKILIIRLSSIGDVLLATPLIRILRKRFPGSKIDFVIKEQFKELISLHPYLDTIYTYQKEATDNSLKEIKQRIKAQKYDVIFDIHKNFRSHYLRTGSKAEHIYKFKKFIFKRWLLVHLKIDLYKRIIPVYQRYIDSGRKLGIEYDEQGLDIFIPDSIRNTINNAWDKIPGSKDDLVIGIAPGASLMTKRWPVEGFRTIIEQLLETYPQARILLFGDKNDQAITRELMSNENSRIFDVAGKYSLLETAALLDYCDLVVTNDTGLMHLASALKKKVVAIFGSTTEQLGFFPCNKEAIVIQNNKLKCRPCSHVGRQECPKKHFKCMLEISDADVLKAIYLLINSGGD